MDGGCVGMSETQIYTSANKVFDSICVIAMLWYMIEHLKEVL